MAKRERISSSSTKVRVERSAVARAAALIEALGSRPINWIPICGEA
jgi:hypothetical protein